MFKWVWVRTTAILKKLSDQAPPTVIESFDYGETREKLLVKIKNGLPVGATDNEELKS